MFSSLKAATSKFMLVCLKFCCWISYSYFLTFSLSSSTCYFRQNFSLTFNNSCLKSMIFFFSLSRSSLSLTFWSILAWTSWFKSLVLSWWVQFAWCLSHTGLSIKLPFFEPYFGDLLPDLTLAINADPASSSPVFILFLIFCTLTLILVDASPQLLLRSIVFVGKA